MYLLNLLESTGKILYNYLSKFPVDVYMDNISTKL